MLGHTLQYVDIHGQTVHRVHFAVQKEGAKRIEIQMKRNVQIALVNQMLSFPNALARLIRVYDALLFSSLTLLLGNLYSVYQYKIIIIFLITNHPVNHIA